ncbi:M81 family metallopeptidase [Dactylosporangium fulvum]|uniref:M81 family metallopeptidase n=1 Tax=Dactylosporangium fulvum TaxID=53359 RepID=A0ABY5VPF2_9ACTN|nr:M81 family metallopeptidase [Dactylosporangium fulvum]UWP78979.1 M81 family metallopeptidase [Dactylosporangium fulvum]
MTLPRVAVLGLWHETNTYGPNPADLAAFEAFELVSGDDVRRHHAGDRSVISGFLAATELDPVPVHSAGAWPSGPASAETLIALVDRLTGALAAAARPAPFDGVLLNLHGAMVAAGAPDVEALIVRHIRTIVGDVPVAAVLDLHANPSPAFVAACTVVLAYDTYPHVDMWERGREAAALLAEAVNGRALTTTVAKTPLLTCPLSQSTDAEPMRGLLARAKARAEAAGIARISLTPGFAYSDVDRAGISVLVVADAHLAADARRVANDTLADIESHAADFDTRRPDATTAVREALAASAAPQAARPVVLADVADNIGGGSPGDGTALLAELIAQDAPDAVVVIADAEVARRAAELGVGRTISAEIGAKADDRHGTPVALTAEIITVTDGTYTTTGTWMTGQSFSMGTTAVLRSRGLRVVVTERATPPFHREHLTSVGIDPATVPIIVAKGAVAWRSAFPDAARAIEVATPGVCPVDLSTLPRTTTPIRVVA